MKDDLMGLSRTAEGSLCEEGDHKKLMTGQHLYEVLPFYMEYETRYHNKAGYNDIVNPAYRDEKWEKTQSGM